MRNLLSLSWPMVITESIYLVTVVEMVWLGRLGATSVAGAGIAFVVTSLVITAEVGLTTAARAMIARAVGSDDIAAANHIMGQALLMAVTYGALMTTMGIVLAEPILSLFRVEPDTLRGRDVSAFLFARLDSGVLLADGVQCHPGIR
jgi:Na+-driven multidrug efflux pump